MTVSPGIPVDAFPGRNDLWLPAELLQANWQTPLEVTSSFKTAVESPSGEAEQRWGLMGTPIRSISALLRGYSPESVRAVKAWASRSAVARTLFPVLPDAAEVTGPVSIGGTAIPCNTSFRRFSTQIRVAIISRPSKNELVKASDRLLISTATSVSPTQVVIADALPFALVKGDLVVPLIESRILLSHQGVMHTDGVASLAANAIEHEGPTQLPTTATLGQITTAESHEGLPIFDLPLDWAQPIQWSVARRGGYQASGSAAIPETFGSRGLVGHSLPLVALSRSSAWDIIRFFDSRGGRLHAFWLPSPTTDYFDFLGSLNNTTILVKSGGPIVDWAFRPYIMLQLTDGTTIIRKVQSVSTVSGFDVVVLTTATPQTYTPNQVRRISVAYKCRLDSDELTEQWLTTEVMRATLQVIETENETPIVINDITELTTAGFSAGSVPGACGPIPLFLLSDCEGVAPSITTSDDLTAVLGKTVMLQGSEVCYSVGVVADSGQAFQPVVLSEIFDSCLCCTPSIKDNVACLGQPVNSCRFPVNLPAFGGLEVELSWEVVDLRAGCCRNTDTQASFRYIFEDRSRSGSISLVPNTLLADKLLLEHDVPLSFDSEATGTGSWCPGGLINPATDIDDINLTIEYDASGVLSRFIFTADAFNLSLIPAIDPNPVITTNTPMGAETPVPSFELCFSAQGCITGAKVTIPVTPYSAVSASGQCFTSLPVSQYGIVYSFRLTKNGIC